MESLSISILMKTMSGAQFYIKLGSGVWFFLLKSVLTIFLKANNLVWSTPFCQCWRISSVRSSVVLEWASKIELVRTSEIFIGSETYKKRQKLGKKAKNEEKRPQKSGQYVTIVMYDWLWSFKFDGKILRSFILKKKIFQALEMLPFSGSMKLKCKYALKKVKKIYNYRFFSIYLQ